MSEILIPALFGLLGVVIGGFLTAGSNYLLDRRREQAINQRDSRNYAIETRRAARLIDAELVRAEAAAKLAIRNKHWWIPDTKLKTEAWQQYSAVLAPVLSYPEWISVLKGVLAIDDLGMDRLTGPLSDATVQGLVPMLRDITAAIEALEPFVLDALPASSQMTRGQ